MSKQKHLRKELPTRNLTVYQRECARNKGYVALPEIRLLGKWLLDSGFDAGLPITVTCRHGELIIRPVFDH